MKRMKFVLLLAFVAALTLQSFAAYAVRNIGPWSRIYEGIDYAEGDDTSPRYMKAYALKVDLQNPHVQLYASHDNGAASKEVTTEKGGTFIAQHGCKVAVNASYCDVTSSTTTPTNVDIWGLGISDGVVVSPGYTSRGAQYNCQMRFTSAKAASIVLSQDTPAGIHTAVTGNAYHLVGGVPLGANDVATARTSFGLSQDGRYLIMVCVNGSGATILDMSYWMLNFGAWDAINMDGGGSTCMVREDVGNVNVPVSNERLVGVHLGVRSTATKGVDVCSMNSSRLDIAVRGSSNNVLVRSWTTSGGWGSWVNLGGVIQDDPAIISRANGYLEVFARGTDNQLYHNWNNGGGWSGWFSLGGSIISSPNACVRTFDDMEVVARWSDHSIRKIAYNTYSGWSGWENHGGITFAAPAIVSRAPGCMEIFHRDMDNGLSHKWWEAYVGWSGWWPLGGDMGSGPATCSRNSSHMEIFCRGAWNDLQHIYWDGWQWSAWQSMGGVIVGEPGACVLKGTDTMKVFARGTNDTLYSQTWTPSGGWTGWVWEGFGY